MFYAGADRYYVVEAILDSATRGGTVIITAPEGGGVSTVLGHAAMRLVDYATVVRIDAEQVHSKNELMNSLLSYFDVPKDDFLSALNHALAQGPLVVLVDNGHRLSAELLELLAKLQQHFTGAFALVVGGQTPLKDNVVTSNAWEEAIFLTLPPLSPADACEFLYKVRSIKVSAEQLAQEAQEFWPQTLMGYLAPSRMKMLPWKHIALALALLLLVLLLWAISSKPTEEKVRLAVTPLVEKSISTPSTSTEPEEEPEEVLSFPTPKNESRKPSVVEERAARDIVFDPEAKKAQAQEREEKAQQQAFEAQKAEEISTNSDEEIPEQSTEQAPSVKASDTPEPSTAQVDEDTLRSQAWLAEQKPTHWMVQVTLASSEQQAQALCEQLGAKNTAYYRALRNDRSVYIVLLGSFATREEAKAEIASLPKKYVEQGPFLRQLEQIQAELQ